MRLLTEFARQHLPAEFHFDAINLNQDFAVPLHVDVTDVIGSQCNWIIGLGDYLGGELWILDENGSESITVDRQVAHLEAGTIAVQLHIRGSFCNVSFQHVSRVVGSCNGK